LSLDTIQLTNHNSYSYNNGVQHPRIIMGETIISHSRAKT
jgi:hypothetical protein